MVGKIAVIVAMICMSLATNSVRASGGNITGEGTETDPFLIEDLQDFNSFAEPTEPNYWAEGSYTKLMADIDLTKNDPCNDAYSAAVIASDINHDSFDFDGTIYDGIFDGNGHVVRNMAITTTRAGADYLGLFGAIGTTAQVKNLGVETVSITLEGDSFCIGAIAGINQGTISDCHASGEIWTNDTVSRVGGIVGYNKDGNVKRCMAVTNVTADDCVGGLIGYNRTQTNANVVNCWASGDVAGDNYTGGLIGFNKTDSKIEKCYAIGNITEEQVGDFFGGLVGYAGDVNDVNDNCFWDVNSCGIETSSGGTSKTTTEMMNKTTFTNAQWDFDEDTGCWIMPKPKWENAGPIEVYPKLQWFCQKGDIAGCHGVDFVDYAVMAKWWQKNVAAEPNDCDLANLIDPDPNTVGLVAMEDLQVMTEKNWLRGK